MHRIVSAIFRRFGPVALLLLLGLALPRASHAEFADAGEPVPLGRLIANVGRYVKEHPGDAQGRYTLGRLYSLAFVKSTVTENAMISSRRAGQPAELPAFPPYESIRQPRAENAGRPDAETRGYLVQSIRHYQAATRLAPDKALYWLGLGWVVEQGAAWAGDVDAPFLAKPRKVSAEAWRDQALAAYRRAYALDLQGDLKKPHLGPESDPSISLEAGEGILRILKRRKPSPAQQAEVTRVRRSVQALQNKPRAITPILFPLDGGAPLGALLAPERAVSFDLGGDGRTERWPWVSPKAGILVWDPEGTGKIVSGRQLFGSATWAMFWDDGYQPLAALDDDRDGWLSGPEIGGLAAWQDANGNAVSEPGEVRPLTELGIARVAVRAAGRSDGVLSNPRGMQRRDGAFVATYDWTATSLPGK